MPPAPPVTTQTQADELIAEGLALRVFIHYADAKGGETRRDVTVQRMIGHRTQAGGMQVSAFEGRCHLRNQQRSFRMDRVLHLADGTTGEVPTRPDAWMLAAATDPATPRAMPKPRARRRKPATPSDVAG